MEYFNVFGFSHMVGLMIPNIIYALKCKDGFENVWENKVVMLLEQIGRFGCFLFMIFLIPGVDYGFSSPEALVVYLLVNTVLIIAYWIIWIIYFRKNNLFKALALSIIPSFVFLFSGIMSHYLPLVIMALLFTPCHIVISYKNVRGQKK